MRAGGEEGKGGAPTNHCFALVKAFGAYICAPFPSPPSHSAPIRTLPKKSCKKGHNPLGKMLRIRFKRAPEQHLSSWASPRAARRSEAH